MKCLLILIILFASYSSSEISAQTWDELVYLGKKHREDGDLVKAIEYLSKAAAKKPSDKHELYLYAGILAARVGNLDEAFALLNKSAISGMWDISRLERNARLQKLKEDERWESLIESINQEVSKYINASNITNPEVRNQLKRMWEKDQNFIGKKGRLDVIKSNSWELKKIISDLGWPTESMVGKDGEWLAWAIAQHSHDVDFQKICLAYLKELTSSKKISPIYYAELTDRIARNTKTDQIYGMAIIRINGKKEFYPIADAENVDKRRMKIGLSPIRVWANENFIDIDSLTNKQSQQDPPLL